VTRLPTAEYVRSLLDYDPQTGVFRWRCNRGLKNVGGKRAGTVTARGYRVIEIAGKTHREQRLAWLFATGHWPSGEVDHRDRDRSNNKLDNLRLATRSQNTTNKAVQKSSQTGIKGVNRRENGTFRAYLSAQGRRINLGTFRTAEEARSAYLEAAKLHHGEFAGAQP
jgi:hypothetical protein